MKYRGFDGRDYSISVADYTVYEDSTRAKSDLHLRARCLLKSIFPCDRILEEVTLPGSKTKNSSVLYADFLIPSRSLIVEVQGEQHYKFIPFFHGNATGFKNARARDNDKREWCQLNGLFLVELPFNLQDDEWRKKIEQRELC
jgi:hypothetical protein